MNSSWRKKYLAIDFVGIFATPLIVPTLGGPYTLSGLISLIVSWLLVIAGALAFIFLVYAGILYITSGGNSEQQKKAQSGLVSAIIGIIVIVLAYVLVRVANNLALGII